MIVKCHHNHNNNHHHLFLRRFHNPYWRQKNHPIKGRPLEVFPLLHNHSPLLSPKGLEGQCWQPLIYFRAKVVFIAFTFSHQSLFPRRRSSNLIQSNERCSCEAACDPLSTPQQSINFHLGVTTSSQVDEPSNNVSNVTRMIPTVLLIRWLLRWYRLRMAIMGLTHLGLYGYLGMY